MEQTTGNQTSVIRALTRRRRLARCTDSRRVERLLRAFLAVSLMALAILMLAEVLP